MCRLLQECFFFTGEKGYGKRAGKLLREGTSGTTSVTGEELLEWWDALEAQEGVAGELGEDEDGGYTAVFWHEERERWLPVAAREDVAILTNWERQKSPENPAECRQKDYTQATGLAKAFGAASRQVAREVIEGKRD